MRRAVLLALALGLALACAKPDPTPWQPARLSVEVLRGFEADLVAPPARRAPVAVLVDATRSMDESGPGRSPHAVGAKRAARRFIEALPPGPPVWLYAMGAEPGDQCLPPPRVGRAMRQGERPPLLDQLARLRTGGEAGLAGSLDRLRNDLSRAGVAPGSRVVAFSDLRRDCGGDVCTAAARLVEAGVRLDVVVIGSAEVPECLREPAGLAQNAPPPVQEPVRTQYRIELKDPEPLVVGCSSVGGPPVAAPAGRGTVVVDLEPPLRVDAYFAPGRDHVLQVLDFPTLDPPTRHWRWKEAPLEFRGREP